MTGIRVWGIGGDEHRLRIPFFARLAAMGFEVTAVGSDPAEAFAGARVPYLSYELKRFLDPLADVRALRQLVALMRQHRPDIVHGFDTKPSLLAPMAAARAGSGRAVRTITGLGYAFSARDPLALALRPIYRQLQRHVAPKTAMTVFQNEQDLAYFEARRLVQPGCFRLIRGAGVDIEGFRAKLPNAQARAALRAELQLDGKRVITTVARLTRQKGILVLLEAARDLSRRHPDLAFLLVGPRESEGRLAVSASALDQHRPYVRALGVRRDVPALLALTDVFVLPTMYREGLPRALLEAAVAGCAVVTTRMPGCVDVVRDGWNGLVVTPGNAEELARAIDHLLARPEVRLEMGSRNRTAVEAFSLEHVVQAHAKLYRDVLHG